MTRPLQLAFAVCIVASVFAAAEAIHHAGFNPFENAASCSSPLCEQAQLSADEEAVGAMGARP